MSLSEYLDKLAQLADLDGLHSDIVKERLSRLDKDASVSAVDLQAGLARKLVRTTGTDLSALSEDQKGAYGRILDAAAQSKGAFPPMQIQHQVFCDNAWLAASILSTAPSAAAFKIAGRIFAHAEFEALEPVQAETKRKGGKDEERQALYNAMFMTDQNVRQNAQEKLKLAGQAVLLRSAIASSYSRLREVANAMAKEDGKESGAAKAKSKLKPVAKKTKPKDLDAARLLPPADFSKMSMDEKIAQAQEILEKIAYIQNALYATRAHQELRLLAGRCLERAALANAPNASEREKAMQRIYQALQEALQTPSDAKKEQVASALVALSQELEKMPLIPSSPNPDAPMCSSGELERAVKACLGAGRSLFGMRF